MKQASKIIFLLTLGFVLIISAVPILPIPRSYAAVCPASAISVQCTGANSAGTPQSSATTGTITITAGDGIIIAGGLASTSSNSNTLTCSDNLAQTWTKAIEQNNFGLFARARDSVICYIASSVGGADGFTITTSNGATGILVIEAYEILPGNTPPTVTQVCNGGVAANCQAAAGANNLISNPWSITSSSSLTVSVLGGGSAGDACNLVPSFSNINQENNPLCGSGNANISQAIVSGSGAFAYSSGSTDPGVSGVSASFGPVSITSTTTATLTGFLVPNFVNGVNSFSWLYFLIIVLVPMAEIIGIITMERSSVLDRHAIIFIFLSLLLLDSIFGVMLNVVTVAMPFIFGILFGVYLWRGRG